LEIAEIVAVREYADFFAEDVRQRWGREPKSGVG
jgi:hypothetical protein